MKIQLGQIDMIPNKTRKYLLPCLRAYGDDFATRVGSIWKIAIGIGDIITVKSNILFEKHIFILCDTEKDTESFSRFLDWLKEQENIYEEDYAFDNIKDGVLHMLVLKLPEECYEAYETFKRSEFSKMYSKDDLQKFFDERSDVFKVLIRDHNYKLKFSQFIKKEFNVDIHPDDINEEFELDFPISDEEEMFNTHLK